MLSHQLAETLQQSGHSVTVLVPECLKQQASHSHLYRLVGVPDRVVGQTRSVAPLTDWLEYHQLPEVIFLTHPHYFDRHSLAWSRQLKISLLTYFHGFEIRMLLSGNARRRLTISLGNLFSWMQHGVGLTNRTKTLIKESQTVFSNSHFTADLVQTFSGRKATVIGCGISPHVMETEFRQTPAYHLAQRQRRRQKLGWDQRFTVGCIARMVKSKNLQILIHAVRAMNDVQLILIGDGPQRPELERLSAKLGVKDRVLLLPRVSEKQKWTFLRAMDCFCLPSRLMNNGACEGFGIALLEAAAAGCPVIAANSGGMPDIVEPGITGLRFDPDSVSQLIRTIETYRQAPDFGRETNTQLREKIRNRFLWPSVASRILESLPTQSTRDNVVEA